MIKPQHTFINYMQNVFGVESSGQQSYWSRFAKQVHWEVIDALYPEYNRIEGITARNIVGVLIIMENYNISCTQALVEIFNERELVSFCGLTWDCSQDQQFVLEKVIKEMPKNIKNEIINFVEKESLYKTLNLPMDETYVAHTRVTLYFITWCCLLTHIGFLIFFYWIKCFELTFINMFSIYCYGYCLYIYHKERYQLQGILICVELVLRACIATIRLGSDWGFHYYVIGIIAVVFLNNKLEFVFKLMIGIFTLIVFIGNSILYFGNYYLVNDILVYNTQIFNLTLMVSFLMVIIFRYSQAVQKIDHQLRIYGMIQQIYSGCDQLTGIFNRRYMTHVINYFFTKIKISGRCFCIAMIDIDYFKHINDTFGHEQGDKVLIEIAYMLREELGYYGVVSRWGGEEFLALIPNTTCEEARVIMEGIRKTVEQKIFFLEKNQARITISVGISEYNSQKTMTEIIDEADDKLYNAKKSGRNKVCIAI